MAASPKRKSHSIIIDLPRLADRKRRQQRVPFFGTEAEKKVERERLKLEAKNGIRFDHSNTTIEEFSASYIDESLSRLGYKTAERYRSLRARYIVPELGRVKLSQLTTVQIYNALNAWTNYKVPYRETTVSTTTVRHAFTLLHSIVQYAVECEIVTANVVNRITKHRRPRRARTNIQVLDRKDLFSLIKEAEQAPSRSLSRGYLSAEHAFSMVIKFMMFTGVRRGECLGLKWKDVNFDRREVCIKSSLMVVKSSFALKSTKTGNERTLSLSDTLVQMLLELREWQKHEQTSAGSVFEDQGFVFARSDGAPFHPDRFTAAFNALVQRAGINGITLHGLRHTFASILVREGIPMKDVSTALGHSNISTTADIYSHQFENQGKRVAQTFELVMTPE